MFNYWCSLITLVVNLAKTQITSIRFRSEFQISRAQVSDSYVVLHSKGNLISTDYVRFLAIHVDRNLRWVHHVDYVCKKLNSAFYALSWIKLFLQIPWSWSITIGCTVTYIITWFCGVHRLMLDSAVEVTKIWIPVHTGIHIFVTLWYGIWTCV